MTTVPDQLSVVPVSPNYDKDFCNLIERVFVNGKHLPNCVCYDRKANWAKNKINGVWQSKTYGTVTVTLKGGNDVQI